MNDAMKRYFGSKEVLVFPAYLFIFLLLYFPVVWDDLSFMKGDIARFYYPVWKYGAGELAQGRLPLWNPRVSFGAPFLANVQTCVFYPPTVFFHLADFTKAFNFYVLFHLAFAGFAVYLWARHKQVSVFGSFVAGMVFSLSGFVLSMINLTIALCSLAYFPLVLLSFERALDTRSFFWKALCAVFFTLQFLAGDPNVCLITALVCGGIAVCKIAAAYPREGRAAFLKLGTAAFAALLFLGLAAFQLLPFFELFSLSQRIVPQTADEVSRASLSAYKILNMALPYQFAMPLYNAKTLWLLCSWCSNFYLGLPAIALAGWGLVKGGKHRLFLASLMLFSFLVSLGNHSPLFSFLRAVLPFFNLTRYPERFFFIFCFGFAVLAGIGAERLMAGLRSSGARRALLIGLPLLVCLELFVANGGEPLIGTKAYTEPSPFLKKVGEDPAIFRVMGSPKVIDGRFLADTPREPRLIGYQDYFIPYFPLIHGIDDALSYDSMYMRDTTMIYRAFSRTETCTQENMMDFLNIKYLSRSAKTLGEHVRWLQESSGMNLFENKGVLPRAYLVPNALPAKNKEEALRQVLDCALFDPRESVVLQQDAGNPPLTDDGAGSETEKGGAALELLDRRPGLWVLSVQTETPQWLFLSETFYPGWKAYKNGAPTPIYRANYAFQAIRVDAGTTTVRWVFDPILFKVGSWISIVTLLGIAGMLFRPPSNPPHLTGAEKQAILS